MKKTISIILMLALSFASISAFAQEQNAEIAPAQDKQIFNHLSLGVNWGILGRIGIDAAMPITPHVNVRAGVSTMALGIASFTTALGTIDGGDGATIDFKNLSATIPMSYHQNGMDIEKLKLDMKTGGLTSGELLFDIFPSKKKSFHFTVGAFFSSSPLVHATGAALNAAGQSGIPQSDWANTSIFGLTTDKQGNLVVDIEYGMKNVKPYIGIGFGRPVALDRFVSFNFDMGVYVINGIHLYSYNYENETPSKIELNTPWYNQYPDLQEKLGKGQEYFDLLNGIPVLPYLRFNLFFRLF